MKYAKLFPAIVAIAAAGLGCTLREPAIELRASDFDLNPLVGQWNGEYSSEETGRRGEISFTLQAGETEASGGVVMSARPGIENIVAPDRPVAMGVIAPPARQLLTIHFVRKEGSAVVGLLDPYVDPDCACRVSTSFEGNFVNSRTIEGSYTTMSSELSHSTSRGNWKVTRIKRP